MTVIDSSNLPPFEVVSDEVMASVRSRLVEAGGDYLKAGVSLQEIRNCIYTKALRVNPNVEAEDAEAKARKRKPKEAKSSKREPTVSGEDLNSLLG